MPTPVTVTVVSEQGVVSRHDVPVPGTAAHELWLDHLATGRYTIVDDAPAVAAADDGDPDAPPAGSIGAVVSWVRGAEDDEDPADGWHERAALVLAAERATPKPRASLIKLLEGLL